MGDQHSDIAAGVENMLIRCGGLAPGDTVLIIREPAGLGFYDEAIVAEVMKAATDLDLRPTLRQEPFSATAVTPGPDLAAAITSADLTVFLARLGDQLRFRGLPADPRAIVCYALDAGMLGSAFGRLDHSAVTSMRDCIDTALAAASEIRITCPAGTDMRGKISDLGPRPEDTKTIRFPLPVHTPVPAAEFSGHVAQVGFLVGTGSNYFHPYAIGLENTLNIKIDGNRITGFEGHPSDVANAEAHYAMVAERFGIDRNFVHSWHAGIHPGCAFAAPASASFERWSSGAFGNPKLLHFHTCGNYAPGEISLNILDPTVRLDGVPLWDRGRLCPDRVTGGAEILAAHSALRAAFATPAQDCGTGSSGQLSFR